MTQLGRRTFMGSALAMMLILCQQALSDDNSEAGITAFVGVTAIDAVEGVRTDHTVIVRGDRITAVGPSSDIGLPNGSQVIEGSGKYMIPGLWDAHVHLTYEPGITNIFDLFLANGVTSVRDTGGQIEDLQAWLDLAATDPYKAPRIFYSGPLLDGTPTVYDGAHASRPHLGITLTTQQNAESTVDQLVDQGVALLKAYEMLSPEVFRSVVDRAHQNGKPVTGHIPLSMDAIEFAESGIDSLEHLRNLDLACSSKYRELLDERRVMLNEGAGLEGYELRQSIHLQQRPVALETYSKARCNEVVESLKEHNVWQIPTLTLITGESRRHFSQPEWQATYSSLPPPVQHRWAAGTQQLMSRSSSDLANRKTTWVLGLIKQLLDAGVPIMAGTDTPIFLLTPGFSLHEELRLLVDAGMTPLQALESATMNPARYFGLENELGSITEGKAADLVLLDADPLKDIRNTRSINTVMRAGVPYR